MRVSAPALLHASSRVPGEHHRKSIVRTRLLPDVGVKTPNSSTRGLSQARGGTPGRGGPGVRAGTSSRSGVAPVKGPGSPTPLSVSLLSALAVLQALFFLLPTGSTLSRLLGIALALSTLLAARLLRETPATQVGVVAFLSVLLGANFVGHVVATAPLFVFRLWQVAVVLGYTAVLLAGLTAAIRRSAFKSAVVAFGAIGLALLTAEAAIGGPDGFSPTVGRVEWVGPTVLDSSLGLRFAPNTVARSLYPSNPRGYFDEPDALQRRWELAALENSKAQLLFPEDRPGVIRVSITEAPGKVTWHIALNQPRIRVVADERYEVRFRARADSARTVFVLVGEAHSPWGNLGLYREIRVDSAWREYTQTFRATASDRNARLYFDLGAETPSVEFSEISMRQISTNRAVQSDAPRESSVSYRINGQGCRGADVGPGPSPGVRRILILGDGASFGVGVHERDTYAARLQALLNESSSTQPTGQRYEVINCGVRGYSTDQERRLLESVVSLYAPQLILLAVSPDDDRFVADEDAFAAAPAVGSLERFFRTWGLVQSWRRPPPASPNFAAIVDGVRQIDLRARASGARLAVISLHHRPLPIWSGLDSALAKGLRSSNIPFLPLEPVLNPFGEQALVVHSAYDSHPNELAHRVSADAVRKFLADEGLLGGKPADSVATSATPNPER